MTNVSLESNEELVISKRQIKEKPSFTLIGRGTMNNKLNLKSIDLLQEVANMNSDEKFCFFEIKNKITFSPLDDKYIYQIKIKTSSMSNGKKNMFSRGYKLLNKKDIVRRIKQGVYMINPLALIPNNFDLEWDLYSAGSVK